MGKNKRKIYISIFIVLTLMAFTVIQNEEPIKNKKLDSRLSKLIKTKNYDFKVKTKGKSIKIDEDYYLTEIVNNRGPFTQQCIDSFREYIEDLESEWKMYDEFESCNGKKMKELFPIKLSKHMDEIEKKQNYFASKFRLRSMIARYVLRDVPVSHLDNPSIFIMSASLDDLDPVKRKNLLEKYSDELLSRGELESRAYLMRFDSIHDELPESENIRTLRNVTSKFIEVEEIGMYLRLANKALDFNDGEVLENLIEATIGDKSEATNWYLKAVKSKFENQPIEIILNLLEKASTSEGVGSEEATLMLKDYKKNGRLHFISSGGIGI